MGKIILKLLILLIVMPIMAQNKKIAVFDPIGKVGSSVKTIIREEMSNSVVNSNTYIVLERSMIDKVLEESRFQLSGHVNDAEVGELGMKMGADYVFLASISQLDSNYHISCKLVNVVTARIEKQQTGSTAKGIDDLISIVANISRNIFEETATTDIPEQQHPHKREILEIHTPTFGKPAMFIGNKTATQNEVRELLMAIDVEAVNNYDLGLKLHRQGKRLALIGTLPMFFVGALIGESTGYEDGSDFKYQIHPLLLGIILGGVTLTKGITINKKGKKKLKSSVNAYSSSLPVSQK